MDSDNTDIDALAFLKAKRTEDSSGAPKGSEAPTEDDAEAELEVDADESNLEDEAKQDETTEADEEQEESYFEIDGELTTLEQIREWKRGTLRETDYTQKTQAVSQERKEVEALKAKAKEKVEKLDETILNLESLLQTEEEAIDWDDLIETDTSQYLKLQKQQAARRSKLKDAQDKRQDEINSAQQEYLNQQMGKVREMMPDWLDESGKYTELATTDINSIQSYLHGKAFSSEDINQVVDARFWSVFRDAAKYKSLQGKKPKIDKQLKNAPRVIKPTKGSRKMIKSGPLDDVSKKFKQTGSESDALAYLKARRT